MKYSGSIFKRSLIFCISVIAIAGIFWSCSKDDDDVLRVPTISAFTPAEAMVEREVIIIGEHFSHTPEENIVSFNGTVATVTESIPIQITTTVPVGTTIGAGDVTVTVNGQVSNGISFTVIETPAPTITDISTDIGIAGDEVTITGTYFSVTPANNTVSFNGIVATVTESTETSITATVPVGATTGDLTLSVNGKLSNSVVLFRYGIKVVIAYGGDDAEEYKYDAGSVDVGSSDLEICTEAEGEQNVIGLIFRDIQIPASATIDSAYIQFTCDDDDNQEGPLPIDIHGFAEANTSAPFIEEAFNISARTNTTATVDWQAPVWLIKEEKGPDQKTPDLKTIVQEIIGLSGWATGNNIGFKFTNDETLKIHREAEAWEDNDGLSPAELIVIFTVQ
ncbi:MAG: IPT/TIG domain-containing protein [Bacteroidales bacterium]|nr:IPT/TIG domain-containing protein [Bacteroidales bacterium]